MKKYRRMTWTDRLILEKCIIAGVHTVSLLKGKRESLLVLTERKTRYGIIPRVPGKTSDATVSALEYALSKFPQNTFQTVTVDNGPEFQNCNGMEYDKQGNKRLTVYYCHPYASCERGGNERNNCIIRRFFHKSKALCKVTQAACNRVADVINNMPRKILGYATAREFLDAEIAELQKNF